MGAKDAKDEVREHQWHKYVPDVKELVGPGLRRIHKDKYAELDGVQEDDNSEETPRGQVLRRGLRAQGPLRRRLHPQS